MSIASERNHSASFSIVMLIFLSMILVSIPQAEAGASIPVSVSLYKDPQSTTLVDEILNSPDSFDFKPVNGRRNFGLSDASFWFRVEFSGIQESEQLILEISYSLLDVVDIYSWTGHDWAYLGLGDTRPVSNREILHQNFLKILDVPAGGIRPIFIRVRSSGPVVVPISLWKMPAFHQHDFARTLLEGMYFGMLLALILFNLFVYLSIRSASYLYYVGYLSFISLFLLSLEGIVLTYVLPGYTFFNGNLPFISLYMALVMAFKFTASINNTAKISPGLVKVFHLVSLLLMAVLLLGLLLGVRFLTQVTPYLTVLSIGLYAHAIVAGIRAGYRPSYFVGFAFLMLLPGAFLYVLRTIGTVDTGYWPEIVFQAGVALEALLLSLVLSYRIRYAQNQLVEVQTTASRERQRFSRKLIETRDRELKNLAMELHDGLGQNLLVIKNKLSRILRAGDDAVLKNRATRDAQQIAQQTIDDIRRLSHQLHPHILDRLGLKEAIIQVARDTCESQGVRVVCEIEDIPLERNSPLSLHIYRVVQEAVKNCAVHANAREIMIALYCANDQIYLLIEDFPQVAQEHWLDTLDSCQYFGLSNIRHRVELLSGNTVFSHNDSGGFKIEIRIPFSNE